MWVTQEFEVEKVILMVSSLNNALIEKNKKIKSWY